MNNTFAKLNLYISLVFHWAINIFKDKLKCGIVIKGKVNQGQLDVMNVAYDWALKQGLRIDYPSLASIVVHTDCVARPGGWGFPDSGSPTGYDAGVVSSLSPVCIEICSQSITTSQDMKHEFYHVVLFQRTGDPDVNHTSTQWKALGLW